MILDGPITRWPDHPIPVELTNKRVLVVGLGRSGVASALFLQSRGAKVTVSDSKPEAQLRQEIPVLLDHGIAVETGRHGERTFQNQDLIVVSPGVPVDAQPLVQARALGETVIGEVELAAEFLPGPIVAITGSNGKTTTTTLVGEILAKSGLKTLVGGNIGTPAISLVEQATAEAITVLEVSSFQLETIRKFRPKLAVVLNVTPDHLDRHGVLKPTPPPRPVFSRISRSRISPFSTPTTPPVLPWLRVLTRRSSGSAANAKPIKEHLFVRELCICAVTGSNTRSCRSPRSR